MSTITTINLGTGYDTGDGDLARDAFGYVNTNFANLNTDKLEASSTPTITGEWIFAGNNKFNNSVKLQWRDAGDTNYYSFINLTAFDQFYLGNASFETQLDGSQITLKNTLVVNSQSISTTAGAIVLDGKTGYQFKVSGSNAYGMTSTQFYPTTTSTVKLGASSFKWSELHCDTVYAYDAAHVYTATTVASLGSALAGLIRKVSDANSGQVGSIAAGGGSITALVYADGTNWRILGGTGGAGGAFTADGDTQITPTTAITLDHATNDEVALTLNYTTNKAAGNDTGLLISMTDTASPGTSLPIDMQVGGTSYFRVDPAGTVYTDKLLGATVSGSNDGIEVVSGGIHVLRNGNSTFVMTGESTKHLAMASSVGIAWTNSASTGTATQDVGFRRNAAGIIGLNTGGTNKSPGTLQGGLNMTTDVAAGDFAIIGQSAYASAVTNRNGGNLKLRGGDNATGGGSRGSVQFLDPTDDSVVVTISPDGQGTFASGVEIADGYTYAFTGYTDTYINGNSGQLFVSAENTSGTKYYFMSVGDITSGNMVTFERSGSADEFTASSGHQRGLSLGTLELAQSGTASFTGFGLNVVETSTGSGGQKFVDFQNNSTSKFSIDTDGTVHGSPETLVIAVSDETTALTTGTAKVTFRMPFAMTLSEVRASVTTAPTGSTIIVDINESGSTIMTTNKLSIDASEKTSTTAATAAGITDSALADDAEITIDIDQIGSSVAGAGLKVYLIGTRV